MAIHALFGAVHSCRKSTELMGDWGSSSTLFLGGSKVYVCITESYMTLGSFNSQIMSNTLPSPNPIKISRILQQPFRIPLIPETFYPLVRILVPSSGLLWYFAWVAFSSCLFLPCIATNC